MILKKAFISALNMKPCDHRYKIKFTEIIKKVFSITNEYNFICMRCGNNINKTIKINLLVDLIPPLLLLTYNGAYVKYFIKDVFLFILHIFICFSIYFLSHLLIIIIYIKITQRLINKKDKNLK